MTYTLEQGQEVLKDTIKNKITHIDYDRVNRIANEYTKYVSGEDIGSLLKQFNPRESAEQFAQRKELSQAITSDMANRIITPMFKVGRSHADVTISWDNSENSDEESIMAIRSQLPAFSTEDKSTPKHTDQPNSQRLILRRNDKLHRQVILTIFIFKCLFL